MTKKDIQKFKDLLFNIDYHLNKPVFIMDIN